MLGALGLLFFTGVITVNRGKKTQALTTDVSGPDFHCTELHNDSSYSQSDSERHEKKERN